MVNGMQLVSLRRLVIGGLATALVLIPVYFIALRQEEDRSIEASVLLKTPPIDGKAIDVGVEAGKLAPDFAISTPGGARLRLSDLRGRPVIMNFWATWCTSCLTEMPELKALQQDRGHDTFTVLAVNAGETRGRAMEFIDFLQAAFIYGLDVGLTVADAYGVYGLPLSVFIDSGGIVRGVYKGHADRPRLEALTAAAIEARPPAAFPAALRPYSTIPRESVLEVSSSGAGRIVFSSRSLRCDASYCAEPAIENLKKLNGVQLVKLETKDSQGSGLNVKYDPAKLTMDEVVNHIVTDLRNLKDPVYDTPLQVRYQMR